MRKYRVHRFGCEPRHLVDPRECVRELAPPEAIAEHRPLDLIPLAVGLALVVRIREAYGTLFRRGYCHTVEAWHEGRLVGGLYGVSLGAAFFGESMFFREPDASKVALASLVEHIAGWDFTLLDCQVMNPHLASLGAREIPRAEFLALLSATDIASARPERREVEVQADGAAKPHEGRTKDTIE